MVRVKIHACVVKYKETEPSKKSVVATSRVVLDGKVISIEAHESADEREAVFQATLKAAKQIFMIKSEYLDGHELRPDIDEMLLAGMIIEEALHASENNIPMRKSWVATSN